MKTPTKVKVLPLKNWMKHFELLSEEDLTEIPPVYHRNGQYLVSKSSENAEIYAWFELDGKAYDVTENVPNFLLDIKIYEHRPLRDVEEKALKILINGRVAPQELIDLWSFNEFWHEIRNTARSARKYAQFCP